MLSALLAPKFILLYVYIASTMYVHYRGRVRHVIVREQRDEAPEDRRGGLRRQLLADDGAHERRQMIAALTIGHEARTDALDGLAQDRIAPHQQTARFVIFGSSHFLVCCGAHPHDLCRARLFARAALLVAFVLL